MRSRLFPIINTCHKPCFCIGPIKLEMKTKISIPDFEWVFNNWGCPICSGGTYCMPQWKHTHRHRHRHTHTVIYIYLLNHSFKMWSYYFTQLNPIYTHAWQFVFFPIAPAPKNPLCFGKGQRLCCGESSESSSKRQQSAHASESPVWMTIGDGVGVTNGFGDIPGLPPNRYSILRHIEFWR